MPVVENYAKFTVFCNSSITAKAELRFLKAIVAIAVLYSSETKNILVEAIGPYSPKKSTSSFSLIVFGKPFMKIDFVTVLFVEMTCCGRRKSCWNKIDIIATMLAMQWENMKWLK